MPLRTTHYALLPRPAQPAQHNIPEEVYVERMGSSHPEHQNQPTTLGEPYQNQNLRMLSCTTRTAVLPEYLIKPMEMGMRGSSEALWNHFVRKAK